VVAAAEQSFVRQLLYESMVSTSLSNPIAAYPWRAAIMLASAWMAALLLQWRSEWHPGFVPSEVVLALLGVAAVLATTALRTLLDQAASALAEVVALTQFRAWATDQRRFAFHGVAPLIIGATVAIAAGVTIHIAWVPWTGIVLWTFYAAVALLFAAVGQLAWSFGALLVILYRAGQLDMAVQVFAWPRTALRALTRSYLATCVVGIGLYLIAVVAIWVSPGGSWFLTEDQGLVRQLWVLPMATTVVAYLLACQMLLSWIANRVHQHRLTALSLLAQKWLDEFVGTRQPDAASAVTELLKWRQSVEREMAQNLNIRAIGTMIATVALPAAKTVKELVGW
jgi:hypothetical protein